MGDEWIVRVEGQEYGPVDTDALREWRREGRLIPENEVRQVGQERWIPAGELPEVFGEAEPVPPPPLPRDFESAKTWRQIWADTFRIYRRAFVPFMLFGLLTSVPMFVLQWNLPTIAMSDLLSGSPGSTPTPAVPLICVAMFVAAVLAWPVSTAGSQIAADDVLRGQPRPFGAQLSAAIHNWWRTFCAGVLIYGSYFFWFFVPLLAMLALAAGGNLFLATLAVLLIGGFMVYMNVRLFINFLFWQQTAVLGTQPPLDALRESKELARSVPEAPALDRPLYRGAIIASIWLLVLLVLTFGVQFSSMMVRFVGIEDLEQARALAQTIAQAQTPDALMIIAAVGTAAINLLMRPLLAAAFVVLYYDAKARAGKANQQITEG